MKRPASELNAAQARRALEDVYIGSSTPSRDRKTLRETATVVEVDLRMRPRRQRAFDELTDQQIRAMLGAPFVIGFDPKDLEEELRQREIDESNVQSTPHARHHN